MFKISQQAFDEATDRLTQATQEQLEQYATDFSQANPCFAQSLALMAAREVLTTGRVAYTESKTRLLIAYSLAASIQIELDRANETAEGSPENFVGSADQL